MFSQLMKKWFALETIQTWIYIVQMRENGAKVVTSMLDVQFKIIWKLSENRPLLMKLGKTDRFLYSPTILLNSNKIVGEVNRHKAMNWLYIPFQTFDWFLKAFFMYYFMEKQLGKLKKLVGRIFC